MSIIPGGDFVHSACWIQGFYIYTEMMDRIDQSGYYGIPKDIDMDGLTADGRLCRTVPRGWNSKYPFVLLHISRTGIRGGSRRVRKFLSESNSFHIKSQAIKMLSFKYFAIILDPPLGL